jgi:hypothetical protein
MQCILTAVECFFLNSAYKSIFLGLKGEIMHDIDRTNYEADYGEFESDEYGYEFEGEDYEDEYFEGEDYEDEYFEGEGEFYGNMYGESPFSEAEEMELAAELLSVTNEQELDQFIGSLLKKARKAIGKFVASPVGKQLGGIIKGAAKSALPILGSAFGNVLLPGAGGAMGGQLAAGAGSLLGLELEGLSQEDQEFEIARQLVRFGGASVSNAAEMPPTESPQQTAQSAAANAAQQYAPGYLNQQSSGKSRCSCSHRNGGHWKRSGNKIIIYGV